MSTGLYEFRFILRIDLLCPSVVRQAAVCELVETVCKYFVCCYAQANNQYPSSDILLCASMML